MEPGSRHNGQQSTGKLYRMLDFPNGRNFPNWSTPVRPLLFTLMKLTDAIDKDKGFHCIGLGPRPNQSISRNVRLWLLALVTGDM